MNSDDTNISPHAALYDYEKREGGGGGGRAKIQVKGVPQGSKLRPGGGRKPERRFHDGHYLQNQKINNIVKVKYVRNNHDATRHIIQHIDYIQNRERDRDEPERKFYGRDGSERSREQVIDTCLQNRGDDAAMFKIILSPKQNELDHVHYVSEIMRRFEEQTGIKSDWSLVEHLNTDHHHVHIVMPGRDMEGRSIKLKREELDYLREIANEYQYELHDRDYQREMEFEREFGYSREEANLLIESSRDFRSMKDLGVTKPELDRVVREDVLPPQRFDEVYFGQQLQRELMNEVSQDFKSLQSELAQTMQERHPELYPGLIKRLQAEEINNVYFEQLKEFHPAEFREYMNDPTLDRGPVIDRMKQAFPDMFDRIVDHLKEHEPKLFQNYEKPERTERELMANLRETSPELFPGLTRQIRENQLNLVTTVLLANHNPARLEQIQNEQDPEKQKELFERSKEEYSQELREAKEKLAERFPNIYKGTEREPTDTEIIADLIKEKPELFPQAAKEVQRREIDSVLFEKFKELSPELAEQIEFDPEKRGVALNVMRAYQPKLLKEATESVREAQPELFKFEREGPSDNEIIDALRKEKPELFPQLTRKLKEQEIDKAFFEKGVELAPDGLKQYLENPDFDRAELHKLLRSNHPEWKDDIEKNLKENRPELFKYDRTHETDDERFKQLRKDSPELFPGLKPVAESSRELVIEPTERQVKLEQLKNQLVDRAYFDKGREEMADGLVEYLENTNFDRQYVVDGLKVSHPEWSLEIELQLKEHHPQLFASIEKERLLAVQEAQDRAGRTELATTLSREAPEVVEAEYARLVSLVNSKGEPNLERERDLEIEPDRDTENEPDKALDEGQSSSLMGAALAANSVASKLKTGKEFSGIGGIKDPAFVDEALDVSMEANLLIESQQQLSRELADLGSHATQVDPEIFKIQDTVAGAQKDIEEIEKDDTDR